MNLSIKCSVFDVGNFSVLTAPKIASRRLEGISYELSNSTEFKFGFSFNDTNIDSKKWEYYINDVLVDYDYTYEKLKNVKYFIIRNPFERCFSGFIHHFHLNYLENEAKVDGNYNDFWVHNSTALIDYSKDVTADLDVLFKPFPNRIKLSKLQKEPFIENEVYLKKWLIEWNKWVQDNIKFAYKNNMLEEYLLYDDHHAPYLSYYKKLIESDLFKGVDIKFIKMEDIDFFFNLEPHITDSLEIFKKVDTLLFKKFYNSFKSYSQEDELWKSFSKLSVTESPFK